MKLTMFGFDMTGPAGGLHPVLEFQTAGRLAVRRGLRPSELDGVLCCNG